MSAFFRQGSFFSTSSISALFVLLAFVVAGGFLFGHSAKAAGGGTLTGYAWSSNIGWIHMSGSNYGVVTDASGNLSGYAWSSNIGWVSFNANDVSGCPSGGTCQGKVDQTTGAVSGWARAIPSGSYSGGWDGWIHLRGTGYGLTAGSLSGGTCAWSGYAWGGGPDAGSSVVGWIHGAGSDYTITGSGTACVNGAVYPNLSAGIINAQNVVAAPKAGRFAFVTNAAHVVWSSVASLFAKKAHADTNPMAGKPLQLSTPIINNSQTVGTTTSFYGVYFIDVGNNNASAQPGVGTTTGQWDLSYAVLQNGIGAGASVPSVYTIRANSFAPPYSGVGLPEGSQGIVFCADWYGKVSDPNQPLTDRCTAKVVQVVGPPDCSVDASRCAPVTTCSLNKTSINLGESVRLQWDTTHSVSSCTINGTAAAGGKTGSPTPPGSYQDFTPVVGDLDNSTDPPTVHYIVQCTGAGGSGNACPANVTVYSPDATISATPTRVVSGQSTNLTWSGINVLSCVIKGPTGNTIESGNANASHVYAQRTPIPNPETVTTQSTFTISCVPAVGTTQATDSVTVDITPIFHEF